MLGGIALLLQIVKGALDQFAAFSPRPAAHRAHIEKREDNGAKSERKTTKPIEQKENPCEHRLEEGLSPNQKAEGHCQTECAQPASHGISGVHTIKLTQRLAETQDKKSEFFTFRRPPSFFSFVPASKQFRDRFAGRQDRVGTA